MKQMITKTKDYTIVILKAAQKRNEPEAEKIIWEHGRRNFFLREEGKLSIVCPVNDGTEVKEVGIFSTSEEETKRIMDEDPAVKAGTLPMKSIPARASLGICCPKNKKSSKRHSFSLIFLFLFKLFKMNSNPGTFVLIISHISFSFRKRLDSGTLARNKKFLVIF